MDQMILETRKITVGEFHQKIKRLEANEHRKYEKAYPRSLRETVSFIIRSRERVFKQPNTMKYLILILFALSMSCSPARDAQGGYWKKGKVWQRITAHNGASTYGCPPKP